MDNEKIIIDLKDQDQMIKFWLFNLFDEEIKETECALSNEQLILKGAEDEEQELMYTENINRMENYLSILKDTKDKISNCM